MRLDGETANGNVWYDATRVGKLNIDKWKTTWRNTDYDKNGKKTAVFVSSGGFTAEIEKQKWQMPTTSEPYDNRHGRSLRLRGALRSVSRPAAVARHSSNNDMILGRRVCIRTQTVITIRRVVAPE